MHMNICFLHQALLAPRLPLKNLVQQNIRLVATGCHACASGKVIQHMKDRNALGWCRYHALFKFINPFPSPSGLNQRHLRGAFLFLLSSPRTVAMYGILSQNQIALYLTSSCPAGLAIVLGHHADPGLSCGLECCDLFEI